MTEPRRYCPNHSDTPEAIYQHYVAMWWGATNAVNRYHAVRGYVRSKCHARQLKREWKKAYDSMVYWEGQKRVAEEMIQSFRHFQGNGTLIPVQGRGKASEPCPVPLTAVFDDREDLKGHPVMVVPCESLPKEICEDYAVLPGDGAVAIRYPNTDRPEYIVAGDWWRFQPARAKRKNGGRYKRIFRKQLISQS